MRRSSAVSLALVLGCILVLALLPLSPFPATPRRRPPLDSDDQLLGLVSQSIPIPCPRSIQTLLNDPLEWVLTPTSNARVWHVNTERVVPEACTRASVFSARLVGLEREDYSVALGRPTRVKGGGFVVVIPAEMILPAWRVKLVVLLEFGVFDGTFLDQNGDMMQTTAAEVLSVQPAMQYVGLPIKEPVPAVIPSDNLQAPSRDDLPYCSDHESLPGAWDGDDYLPTTCNFHSLPSPHLSSSTPLWINFIGDSNTRNLFSRYVPTLGFTQCTYNFAEGPYPTGIACTGPGYGLSIATFSMWFVKDWVDGRDGATTKVFDRLTDGIAWDVNATLTANRLEEKVDGALLEYWRGKRPMRTYVSMGSHTPHMTMRGARTAMDLLFANDNLHDPSVRLLPITPVNVANIPIAMSQKGLGLTQNNVLIEAKNSLLRIPPHDQIPTIDFWSLTIGVWQDRMKDGDAVHWRDEVYKNLGRVLLSEMVEGEGLEHPKDIEVEQ